MFKWPDPLPRSLQFLFIYLSFFLEFWFFGAWYQCPSFLHILWYLERKLTLQCKICNSIWRQQVNSINTRSISILWCLKNSIPHLILKMYAMCPEDGEGRSENEQNALYTCMKCSEKNNLKCIPMTSLRYRRYGQNIHHEYCFYI